MLLIDLAPLLNFLARLLLIGIPAALVAIISLWYTDAVITSSFWGIHQGSGFFVAMGLGLVLVAVMISYWLF